MERRWWTRALAGLVVISAAGPVSFAQEWADSRRVYGRVVDEKGEPIAGAALSMWAPSAGQLRDPAMTKSETDADGRFDLRVAFPHTRYSIWARQVGYSSESAGVLAGSGRPVEVKLKRLPSHTLSGSVVSSVTHRFVAGARVVLTPEYGGPRETTTGEKGRFEFGDLPESIGQEVIHAEHEGLISPYQMARGRDREVGLVLFKPAGLKGIVVEQSGDGPMADCTVTARPRFMSGFSITTKSGKDGRFALTDVPPGEYTVGAERADLYELPNRGTKMLERVELPLAAGEEGFLRIRMGRRVAVKGRVVGPDDKPVAGAVVGMRVRYGLNPNDSRGVVETDGQGRFTILSGRVNQQETVEAFSARYGGGRANVHVDEELPDDATIRLSGAIRVRGVVVDEAGEPVEGVSVGGSLNSGGVATNARGRFDMGWIPLSVKAGEDQPIIVRCPRPGRGDLHAWRVDGTRMVVKAPELGRRFFLHKKLMVKGGPGHQADLKIALEPTEVLTFTGRVLDPGGDPVPKADVILFAGNANTKTWTDDLHPERSMLSSGRAIFDDEVLNVPLCRTVADEQGRWTIWVVRETGASLKFVRPFRTADASRYSLGVEDPTGESILLKDITLEKGANEKRIDVKLKGAAGSESGRVLGQVMDDAGKPVAGIVLRTAHPVHRVTTGADGRFTLMHLSGNKVGVRIDDKEWGILSPVPARGNRWWVQIEVPSSDVRIVIGKMGRIVGRVRWASGEPVTTFTVTRRPATRSIGDKDGRFVLEDCPPGPYELLVCSAEGVVARQAIDVPPGGETTVDIVLPEADCTIRGQVVDQMGEAAGGSVKMRASGSAFEGGTMPDADGRFAFKVPAGSYRVSAHSTVRRWGEEIGRTDVSVGKESRSADVSVVVDAG